MLRRYFQSQLIILLPLLLVMIVGCGDDDKGTNPETETSPLADTWELVVVKVDGVVSTPQTDSTYRFYEDEELIELSQDGTGQAVENGDYFNIESWKASGDSITLQLENDQPFTVEYLLSNDTLTVYFPSDLNPDLERLYIRSNKDISDYYNVPIVTTSSVINISQTTALCGGNVTSAGTSTVTARGICWSTSSTPTISDSKTTDGSGTGGFTSSLTGLTAGTSYYVRAYATNSAGTSYGSEQSFTTESQGGTDSTGTVTDIDGNVYQTIRIGDQWWMMENLEVTHYRNGEPIPHVTDDTTWSGLTSGAYCNYNNYTDNVATYGRLYNWYAVDDTSNIAPEGWHVPTDEEWQTLIDYLGSSVASGKLKETGTTHWTSPNTGATNESGFTALPGGLRISSNGSFYNMGYYADFWSSAGYSGGAWFRRLTYDNSQVVYGSSDKRNCRSVRCVRD